jgi:dienelactone hydrolase
MRLALSTFSWAAVAAILLPACVLAAEVPVRNVYTPISLFNGQDLSAFYTFLLDRGRDSDPKQVFTVKDGMIVISGEEWGCLTTKEVYSRYHLIAEFRWGPRTFGDRAKKARDNGILVHSTGEDGGYSNTWMPGIECQIIEGGTGDLLVVPDEAKSLSMSALYFPGLPEGQKNFHVQGQPITMDSGRLNWWGRDPKWEDVIDYRGPDDVENWPGEWNRYEAVVDGPNIRVYLNGALVNAADNLVPSEGRIQIQSEGAEMHVRRFELHPIWAPPAAMKRSKLTTEAYTDRQGNVFPMKAPEDWAKFRSRMRWNMAHISGVVPPPPTVESMALELGEANDMGSYTLRRITFAVDGPDDRVPALLLVPKVIKGKAAGIVALHQTTPEGKEEPAGVRSNTELAYGKELAERGHVVICPDYVTFGEYNPDYLGMGYVSGTAKGVRNHMAAVSILQSLPEVDANRIGAIGHSLGGHNTLFLTLFDERVKAAATSCGFDSVETYYEGDLTGWVQDRYMPRVAWVYGKEAKRMPIDYTEILAAIAPRPVYVNAPLRDGNFVAAGVDYCVAFANAAYHAQGFPDGIVLEHPDAEHSFPKAQREAAYTLLERALAPGQ